MNDSGLYLEDKVNHSRNLTSSYVQNLDRSRSMHTLQVCGGWAGGGEVSYLVAVTKCTTKQLWSEMAYLGFQFRRDPVSHGGKTEQPTGRAWGGGGR